MIRVHVICEGPTEETFVNQVLLHQFSPRNIHLYPALIGKPGHKGGNLKFERLFIDVRDFLLKDTRAYCTTLFDFYGLPTDFPGKGEAKLKKTSKEKAECVQRLLTEELKKKLGENTLHRFIPYVQMYEFEGLLFSDPAALAREINQLSLQKEFETIRGQFDSPEEINDSPQTSPSNRIESLFRGYDKPLHGSLVALGIGLEKIRNCCPLFDKWLKRIEEIEAPVITTGR